MALTERNPVEAFESALAWADHGGGEAAQHCAAVALLRQGKAEPAAHRMEQIARESRGTDALVRAGLLAQAAQAWIVAGQLSRAESALTTALGLTPQDAQLLLDRGAVRGQLGRYGDAIVDLNAAIQGNPDAADAFVLRASALRQLNRLREAMTDAEQALRLDSGNPDAYLERGQIRRLANDAEGARADFMQALTLAPNSPTGDAAQRAIEQMALAR